MKKIFTLPLALAFATVMNAQTDNIGMNDPVMIDDLHDAEVQIQGVNNDGSIIWGQNLGSSIAIYNFNNAEGNRLSLIDPADDDVFGVSFGNISDNNIGVVSHYMHSYVYDAANCMKIADLESPKKGFGIDAWCISADGNVIGANLVNDNMQLLPVLALRQADGSYEYMELDFDPNDAFGEPAQYTMVRFMSRDAKHIIGIQPDNRGMGGRLVVWNQKEDGTYEFTTPLDEYLYDSSVPTPGQAPEFDDYVTADYETDPELFDQQMAEYDAAFTEYEANYKKFTRNGSALEIYLIHMSSGTNTLGVGFYDRENCGADDGDNMEYLIPMYYNIATGDVKTLPNFKKNFAYDMLPTGECIFAKDKGGVFEVNVFDKKTYSSKSICSWLADKTGKDISEQFSFSFHDWMNDVEVEGEFPGLPQFSRDGKTLVFAGIDPNENLPFTSVIRFDSSIFGEDTPTGIRTNIVSQVTFRNGAITVGDGKHAVAEIYNLSGAECGTYSFDGTLNLNGTLAAGTYVAKVNVGGQTTTMKLLIK